MADIEHGTVTYYSGCNYYINTGKNEYEPVGTALSMHDCGDCEKIEFCKLKKESELWEYNDVIKEQMNKHWDEMEIRT